MRFIIILLATASVCFGQRFTFRDPAILARFNRDAVWVAPETDSLVFWGDSSRVSFGNGAAITNWLDYSGRTNDWTNATAGAGSGAILTNVAEINSKNAIKFLSLTAGSLTNLLTSVRNFMGGSRTGEMFVVMRSGLSPGSASRTTPWRMNSVNFSGNPAHPLSTDSKLYENFGWSISIPGIPLTNYSGNYYTTNWHIYHVQTGTNHGVIRYNGDLISGITSMSNGAWTNAMQLGGNGPGALVFEGGEIAEMLIYTQLVTTASLTNIYAHLSGKYGIAYTNVLDTYSPTNFNGLAYWFKASNITSNNNDPIGTWVDIQGRGNWVQNTAGNRPLYIASSTINSLPAVRFDGVDDFMDLPASFTFTNNATILVVHACTADTRVIIGDPTTSHQFRNNDSGLNNVLFYNGSGVASAAFPTTTNAPKMSVAQRWGTSIGTAWCNTSNATITVGSGSYTFGRLGKTQSDTSVIYKGDIAEIIVFTNLLNYDSIMKLYFTYLAPTYGLPR